jgi:hypothetical protein
MKASSNAVPYEIDINDLAELMPGSDLGLDVLCDGILEGSEFIYPAENITGVIA